MRATRTTALLVALACVVGAVTGMATASGGGVKSTVKITEGGPDHFEGKVTSPEAKCEKRRKVTLQYKLGAGYKRDEVIGTTKTDNKGLWELDGAFQAGLYRAVIDEVEKGDFTCKAFVGVRKQF
jgi:hypothetical protein